MYLTYSPLLPWTSYVADWLLIMPGYENQMMSCRSFQSKNGLARVGTHYMSCTLVHLRPKFFRVTTSTCCRYFVLKKIVNANETSHKHVTHMTISAFPESPNKSGICGLFGWIAMEDLNCIPYRLDKRPHLVQCQPLVNAKEVVISLLSDSCGVGGPMGGRDWGKPSGGANSKKLGA